MLIFATGNANKLIEIKMKVGNSLDIKSLAELNFTEEIPEPYETIKENAIHKAEFIHKKFGKNCFAEDTGLCVNALNGEPGVYSARYAGEQKNASDNMDLLMKNLQNKTDRSAHFLTVIALIYNDELHVFEGKAEGEIIAEKVGTGGFGYDPIFYYPPYDKTFGQLNVAEKNKISHRAKATEKLVAFLNSIR